MAGSDDDRVQGRFAFAGVKASSVQLKGAALGVGQRGVLLPPPVRLNPRGGLTTQPFDRRGLDAALLYWDAIEYPENRLADFGPDEIDALVNMGAVTRSMVHFSGSWEIGEAVTTSHTSVFDRLSAQSPGRWSQIELPTSLAAAARMSQDVATIRLVDQLPLPPRDLPFEELLEFKARRLDELKRLRTHIDDMASFIASAADGEAALVTRIDDLHISLKEARAVTQERFGIFGGFSIAPSFSISDALKAGIPAFLAIAGVGGATPLAALAGAGAAAAWNGISLDVGRAGGQSSTSPLKYALAIEDELERQ